jgi:N-acetylmuramoyl-L-alanine amidase
MWQRLKFITKVKVSATGAFLLLVCAAGAYWEHNIEWSARVAWGEARGEPPGGMQAVLNVMANRKEDFRFPKSLSSVAKQPYQFTAFNENDPNRPKLEVVDETDSEYRSALRMAAWAQVGLLPDITGGATYFHSNDIARPDYLEGAEVSAVIGNHIFYTGVEW